VDPLSRPKVAATPVQSATWSAMIAMIEPYVVARFTVPGEPVSKDRPRFDPEDGHVYTPRKTTEAETTVGWAFKAAVRGWQLDASTAFGVMALFRCATTRGRRDGDNLLKLLLDALNGVAWKDDAQVHEEAARVVRGAPTAGTDVLIYRIPLETPDAN
jgi:Holliday junction resolvase RusA-like endonuclease